MFSLNPPHLLSPTTAFFTSSPRPQLGTFLLFISTRWWSQPLKQPRHHPHSSTTFLCLFTARLHNSLARQKSKNVVCPITAAAPPPFYWCMRRDSEWVCRSVCANGFSSSQREVWLDRYGNLYWPSGGGQKVELGACFRLAKQEAFAGASQIDNA